MCCLDLSLPPHPPPCPPAHAPPCPPPHPPPSPPFHPSAFPLHTLSQCLDLWEVLQIVSLRRIFCREHRQQFVVLLCFMYLYYIIVLLYCCIVVLYNNCTSPTIWEVGARANFSDHCLIFIVIFISFHCQLPLICAPSSSSLFIREIYYPLPSLLSANA